MKKIKSFSGKYSLDYLDDAVYNEQRVIAL